MKDLLTRKSSGWTTPLPMQIKNVVVPSVLLPAVATSTVSAVKSSIPPPLHTPTPPSYSSAVPSLSSSLQPSSTVGKLHTHYSFLSPSLSLSLSLSLLPYCPSLSFLPNCPSLSPTDTTNNQTNGLPIPATYLGVILVVVALVIAILVVAALLCFAYAQNRRAATRTKAGFGSTKATQLGIMNPRVYLDKWEVAQQVGMVSDVCQTT